MTQVVTLHKIEFLVGSLNEDLQELASMVMKNYDKGYLMSKEETDIRYEDVRIDFNPQVQRIIASLCEEWKTAFGQEIESCYTGRLDQDHNESVWAVVHNPGDITQLHTHETAEDYRSGAHVSAAFWVQVPEDSGDFVFQYKRNPYLNEQTRIKSEPGKFLMFDSTMKHFVTKNRSQGQRIVVSMNFRFKEEK